MTIELNSCEMPPAIYKGSICRRNLKRSEYVLEQVFLHSFSNLDGRSNSILAIPGACHPKAKYTDFKHMIYILIFQEMSVIYMLLYTNPDILRRMQCKEHLQSFVLFFLRQREQKIMNFSLRTCYVEHKTFRCNNQSQQQLAWNITH